MMTCWHGWGCTILFTSSLHFQTEYIESVWAHSYAVDGHMCTPLYCYTTVPAKLTQIWVIWGWWGKIMTCWHGWGFTTPLTFSPLQYCICRKCLSAGQVDPDLGNMGIVEWSNDVLTWLRLYSSPHFFSTSILCIYRKCLSTFICRG